MNIPRYPIFIPTKGRSKTPYTISIFERLGIEYHAVIEQQEYDDYASVVKNGKIIVLPHQNKGLTTTRNWIWNHAQYDLGVPFFWTFDDNIRDIYRLHKNQKYRVDTPAPLAAIEDFAARYSNLFICGMNYEMFVPKLKKKPPITFNTRIYSNMLIKSDIPFRNETFFNDDTDLCLRVLKSGACTALFNAFLIDKIATMYVRGGMTDYYQATDKRLEFAKELQEAHPDVVKIVRKYGRWHHQVNYSPFRSNKLLKCNGIEVSDTPNNYGMTFTSPAKTANG